MHLTCPGRGWGGSFRQARCEKSYPNNRAKCLLRQTDTALSLVIARVPASFLPGQTEMKSKFLTTAAIFAAATALACAMPVLADDFGRDRDHDRNHDRHPHEIHTETPIKHLVII